MHMSCLLAVPACRHAPRPRARQDTNKVLAISRIMVAWQPVGLAMGVYDMCARYVRERRQFGSPLGAFQLVQERLARMQGDVQAMFLMAWRLSVLHEQARLRARRSAAPRRAPPCAACMSQRAVLCPVRVAACRMALSRLHTAALVTCNAWSVANLILHGLHAAKACGQCCRGVGRKGSAGAQRGVAPGAASEARAAAPRGRPARAVTGAEPGRAGQDDARGGQHGQGVDDAARARGGRAGPRAAGRQRHRRRLPGRQGLLRHGGLLHLRGRAPPAPAASPASLRAAAVQPCAPARLLACPRRLSCIPPSCGRAAMRTRGAAPACKQLGCRGGRGAAGSAACHLLPQLARALLPPRRVPAMVMLSFWVPGHQFPHHPDLWLGTERMRLGCAALCIPVAAHGGRGCLQA
jgi:hypothetical protein